MNKYMERQKRQQKERDSQVIAWLSAGTTKSDIARKLGVSRQRAEQIINRIRSTP
jgi:transposase